MTPANQCPPIDAQGKAAFHLFAGTGSPSPEPSRGLSWLFYNHYLTILIVWATLTTLAILALWTFPSSYVADAKLLVRTEQQGRPSLLSGVAAYKESQISDTSSRRLETEMELITSKPLIEKVVQRHDLTDDQMYHPPLEFFVTPIVDFVNRHKWWGVRKPPEDRNALTKVASTLQKNIVVQPAKSRSGESSPNVIEVHVRTSDPLISAEALNELLSQYRQFALSLDQSDAEQAYRDIAAQSLKAEERLKLAQRRVEALLSATSAVNTSTMGRSPRSASIDPAATAAPSQGAGPLPETTAGQLRQRLTQLELELIEQEQIFTPKMASVITLKANISDVRAKLMRELEKSAREGNQLTTAQRELTLAENSYFELERKLTQIGVLLKLKPEEDSTRLVVEAAQAPSSSEWKKVVLLGVLCVIGAFLLGLLAAGTLELLDHRLRNEFEVGRYLGLPVLGSLDIIPSEHLAAIRGDCTNCSTS